MINIEITIFISINMFFAGYYLSDNYKWADTKIDKISCILWCVGTMFCGCIYILLCTIYALCSLIYNKINEHIQVYFFVTFLFTKRWHNLEKHRLQKINRISINVRNTQNIKDRIYRYCIRLINKRNNYVYNEQKD